MYVGAVRTVVHYTLQGDNLNTDVLYFAKKRAL